MTTPPQPPRRGTTRKATAGRDPDAPATTRGSAVPRESRYRRRPPGPAGTSRDPEANRVLRLVLTEPDTVPMTEQQHQQAIKALSAMIVAWLQRQAHHGRPPTG